MTYFDRRMCVFIGVNGSKLTSMAIELRPSMKLCWLPSYIHFIAFYIHEGNYTFLQVRGNFTNGGVNVSINHGWDQDSHVHQNTTVVWLNVCGGLTHVHGKSQITSMNVYSHSLRWGQKHLRRSICFYSHGLFLLPWKYVESSAVGESWTSPPRFTN